jgi:selenocysteine lyase/cysteine desulfurase
MPSRRALLRGTAAAAALAAVGLSPRPATASHHDGEEPLTPPLGDPEAIAQDEGYWRKIARQYDVSDAVLNLEAGYFGTMAKPVLAAYQRHVIRVNREGAAFARREYPAIAQRVRGRVAAALGVAPGELAFARNATEALQTMIRQYAPLAAGDTVLFADLDYPAMQDAMRGLAAARGATVATLDIPEPASREAVLAAYTAALDANPRTKLVLLTHVNNKTGLVHPVRELTALAAARGADVVLDSAHAFGQIPMSIPEIGAPFVGVNLHKWVGAPVGVAAFYIRKDRLDAITPAPGEPAPHDRIDARLHTGTTDFAAVMAVEDALAFQETIGVPVKAARLRYLRNRWAIPARAIAGVDVLTPDDPAMVGAITSFRLRGDGDERRNQALARTLADEFGIFTVARSGLARGDCIRVTPALHSTPAGVERLVAALRVLAAR